MKTLALVVPCHNEAKRLDVDAFVRAAEEWPWISFCFVDDGSTVGLGALRELLSLPSICRQSLVESRSCTFSS